MKQPFPVRELRLQPHHLLHYLAGAAQFQVGASQCLVHLNPALSQDRQLARLQVGVGNVLKRRARARELPARQPAAAPLQS